MSKEQILAKLQANELSIAEASALLTALDSKKSGGNIYLKISKKGAISIYGLQRMPVTMYREQWERFFKFLGVELPKPFADLVGKTETFPISKYDGEDDAKWLAAARNGEHKHATIKGDSVIVGLSEKAA